MRRFVSTALTALCLVASGVAHGDKIEADLRSVLAQMGPTAKVGVLIGFVDDVETDLFGYGDAAVRRKQLLAQLQAQAKKTQSGVLRLVQRNGSENVMQLWLVNEMSATVDAGTIRRLYRRPEVDNIRIDRTVGLWVESPVGSAPPAWNHLAINTPDLWRLGFYGQGSVIAAMDTGVDLTNEALSSSWRGGTNSWFDPGGVYPNMPVDLDPTSHGTGTMGLVVAADAGGQAIGVAPGAQWIAVKIFDDSGIATASDIHAGFQWLLDPDGDPTTDDAPDAVNNSWVMANTINQCNPEYQADIAALRAAGISVVFAAGNFGPNASTSVSPADDQGSTSVGAVDDGLNAYLFSSRGPSACGEGAYPRLAAPGVNVLTTMRTFGFGGAPTTLATGTSVAAPHVTGAIALLRQAFPDRAMDEIEQALVDTAVDLGTSGPDDTFGYGLIDVFAAYLRLVATSPAIDRVKIRRVRYRPRRHELSVKATSSLAPDAVLTLLEYGGIRMEYDSERGFYKTEVARLDSAPETVTVVSTLGGSDTKPVPYPDRVTISKAIYHTDRNRLIIEARSDSQPDVVLSLPEYGGVELRFQPHRGLYRRVVSDVAEKPSYVTVVSAGGGRDTEAVPFKADSVKITKTFYKASRQLLIVIAKSNEAPGVNLFLPEYGLKMTHRPRRGQKGDYKRVIWRVAENPGTVVVDSSGGGIDIQKVPYP